MPALTIISYLYYLPIYLLNLEKLFNFFQIFVLALSHVSASVDITDLVFGSSVQGQPAAFGDFDSDELTDIFILKDQGHTIEIMFGSNVEPFLKQRNGQTKCSFVKHQITSVVPGDFNGDALMDLLVTVKNLTTPSGVLSYFSMSESQKIDPDLDVHILWGGLTNLKCANEEQPLFTIVDQPLVINYDTNMIVDLFGVKKMANGTKQRMFWLFNSTGNFTEVPMILPKENNHSEIRIPQSHGFINLGGGKLFRSVFIS